MSYRMQYLTRMFLLVALLSTLNSTLDAEDYFLTIGGGYNPTGNQLSIESNVLMVQRVLAEQRPDLPSHDLYFSDGNDPQRDLQFYDDEKASQCAAAQRIMTEVFGKERAIGTYYRSHKVPNVIGPTELAAIKRRFRELSRKLTPDDRLIVYVTGHGGEAETESNSDDDYEYEYDYEEKKWKATYNEDGQNTYEEDVYNTTLHLWNSETIEAREFSRWLDKLNPDVTVVLVMVQCYSGGFSHVLFQRLDTELGLSPARRCGFFSQHHDRAAAGCTADSNEADYEEYSTYFWAALGGKTRVGEELDPPDYDKNGQVSFAEAHAYAVIESDTIDIPLRTSESFLQQYSRLGRQGDIPADPEVENPVSKLLGVFGGGDSQPEPEQELDNASGTVADQLASATKEQQAILMLLPEKLGLEEPLSGATIRLKLQHAESELSVAEIKRGTASKTAGKLKKELRNEIYEIWPELSNGYSPTLAELTGERADEFTATVAALATYQAWQTAKKRAMELAEEQQAAERYEARVQRLLKTLEAVALAKNLPKVAPTEIVERYRQLISMEEQSLAEPE